MHEIISEAPPSTSGKHVFAFIALSIGVILVGVVFAFGVFTGMNQTYLGVVLAAGFAILAGMLVLYDRMSTAHRIVLEYDEDLW
jgi:hypothetical protein